jgi:Cullin family
LTSHHTYHLRNAYNMVLHKFGDRLYSGLQKTLIDRLKTVAAKIEAAQGEPFLKELKKRWDEHNKSTQMIRDILMVSPRPRRFQIRARPDTSTGGSSAGWCAFVATSHRYDGCNRVSTLPVPSRTQCGGLFLAGEPNICAAAALVPLALHRGP